MIKYKTRFGRCGCLKSKSYKIILFVVTLIISVVVGLSVFSNNAHALPGEGLTGGDKDKSEEEIKKEEENAKKQEKEDKEKAKGLNPGKNSPDGNAREEGERKDKNPTKEEKKAKEKVEKDSKKKQEEEKEKEKERKENKGTDADPNSDRVVKKSPFKPIASKNFLTRLDTGLSGNDVCPLSNPKRL